MGANIGKLNGYDNKYVTSELGRQFKWSQLYESDIVGS